MFKVGLTGGIGSGKSVVARVFAVLGIPVFDADRAGKELLAHDPAVRTAVTVRFGTAIYVDGTPDRAALATIVFQDPQALQDLNAIIHPAVRNAFREWAALQKAPYVIMESALLADTQGHRAFDRVITVKAPEELRVQRVMARDGVGKEKVLARMANQVDDERRQEVAHHVIHNDDHQLVIPQVLELHKALINDQAP